MGNYYREKSPQPLSASYQGFLFGTWSDETQEVLRKQNLKFCFTPIEFVIMTYKHNCNFFYNNSEPNPKLTAMVFQQKILSSSKKENVSLLASLLHGGYSPTPRSLEKTSFDSYITIFGPFHFSHKKGKT